MKKFQYTSVKRDLIAVVWDGENRDIVNEFLGEHFEAASTDVNDKGILIVAFGDEKRPLHVAPDNFIAQGSDFYDGNFFVANEEFMQRFFVKDETEEVPLERNIVDGIDLIDN